LPENYSSSDRANPIKWWPKPCWQSIFIHEKNTEAANEATTVINSPLCQETDLNKIFLRNSKTTIWQLASATAVRNSNEGTLFCIRTATSLCACTDFMNAFETGDQRKVNWTKSVTTGLGIIPINTNAATTSSQEYSIVLRKEQYFQSRGKSKRRFSRRKEDLNKIRTTAGLPIIISTIATEILI
jgi:hypothetical protein